MKKIEMQNVLNCGESGIISDMERLRHSVRSKMLVDFKAEKLVTEYDYLLAVNSRQKLQFERLMQQFVKQQHDLTNLRLQYASFCIKFGV